MFLGSIAGAPLWEDQQCQTIFCATQLAHRYRSLPVTRSYGKAGRVLNCTFRAEPNVTVNAGLLAEASEPCCELSCQDQQLPVIWSPLGNCSYLLPQFKWSNNGACPVPVSWWHQLKQDVRAKWRLWSTGWSLAGPWKISLVARLDECWEFCALGTQQPPPH